MLRPYWSNKICPENINGTSKDLEQDLVLKVGWRFWFNGS